MKLACVLSFVLLGILWCSSMSQGLPTVKERVGIAAEGLNHLESEIDMEAHDQPSEVPNVEDQILKLRRRKRSFFAPLVYFTQGAGRQSGNALADLFWALVESPEKQELRRSGELQRRWSKKHRAFWKKFAFLFGN